MHLNWAGKAGCSRDQTVHKSVDSRPRRSRQTNLFHLTEIPQSGISYAVVFIESAAFTRRLYQLAGVSADRVLSEIQGDLLENRASGKVVRGLGGIRKGRSSNPVRGKGKRGGFRYLYLHLEHRGHIHLLLLFDKDEQEDLTTAERAILREMVTEIKGR